MAAARDLSLEGGLEGLSMRKVAARCGLTATAIHRHFPDKDALLTSTIDAAFGLFTGYLSRALHEREPLERLREMTRQYFAFGREHHRYALARRRQLPEARRPRRRVPAQRRHPARRA